MHLQLRRCEGLFLRIRVSRGSFFYDLSLFMFSAVIASEVNSAMRLVEQLRIIGCTELYEYYEH